MTTTSTTTSSLASPPLVDDEFAAAGAPPTATQPLPSTVNSLKHLCAAPGLFATIYFDLIAPEPADRWKHVEASLKESGATPDMIATARRHVVDQDHPDDVGAIAVMVSETNEYVADYGLEPPATDFVSVDGLPYTAPLLEWVQRRVPHLVIVVDESGCDIVAFGAKQFAEVVTHEGHLAALSKPISKAAELVGAELIVVSGSPFLSRRLAEDLVLEVAANVRVVAEQDATDADELSDATVRHVSDTAARRTVGFLRELRFMASHNGAVDGTIDTIEAVRRGEAEILLIHNDVLDDRRVWIGSRPEDISFTAGPSTPVSARLVDAAIRAALLTDTKVHIIPSTGAQGPREDAAALRVDR